MDTDDQRPVVLATAFPDEPPGRRRPRPRTVLGFGTGALLGAAGVVAGSWSVWSALNTPAPAGDPPEPLWFSPPAMTVPVTGTSASVPDNPATAFTPPAAGTAHRGSGTSTGSSTGTGNRATATNPASRRRGEEDHATGHEGGDRAGTGHGHR